MTNSLFGKDKTMRQFILGFIAGFLLVYMVSDFMNTIATRSVEHLNEYTQSQK